MPPLKTHTSNFRTESAIYEIIDRDPLQLSKLLLLKEHFINQRLPLVSAINFKLMIERDNTPCLNWVEIY